LSRRHNDDAALQEIIPELRAAMAEHIHVVRERAAEAIPETFKPIETFKPSMDAA
jgi:hypothetical protein